MDLEPVTAHPSISSDSADGLDAVSVSWLKGMRATGSEHAECVARLHALLLRVAHHELLRRTGSLQLGDAERDDVAHQASDDALSSSTTRRSSGALCRVFLKPRWTR